MIESKHSNISLLFIIFHDFIKLILNVESYIKKRIFYSLTFILITIFLNALSPLLLKELIKEFSVSLDKNKNVLLILGFSYGFSWGVAQVTMQLREIISFKIIERITRALTLKIFNKINSFPIKFFVNHQLGDALDTINKAQEGLPYLFLGLFFYLIPTIIEITIACIVLTVLLPLKFTAIFLVMLVVYLAFSIWGLNKVTIYQRESIEKSHKVYSYLVDRLLNYETIKIFCKQAYESKQLDLQLKQVEEVQTNASVVMESIRLGQGAILGFSLLFLTLTGILAFTNHEIHLESFILVNAYFMQLSNPLNYFSLIIKDIKNGLMYLRKAYELLDKKSEYNDHSSGVCLKDAFKEIKFKNVSFSYSDGKSTLHNLNFCLEKGKVISLVGKTGSGKSTIAKLLLRFYDPLLGLILVDGKPYGDFPVDILRQNIGYVPQDPVLFCNTIRYNLTYGNPIASTKEIEEALEKANLGEFISALPNGIETFIGERGISLSGGEKQRLALARIFLTKKDLYIFDEATSALDSKTQQSIQNHIFSLKKDSSVLIISHRLASVTKSDEIFVLSQGQIIERGTHSSLLSLNENYSSLWNSVDSEKDNSWVRSA